MSQVHKKMRSSAKLLAVPPIFIQSDPNVQSSFFSSDLLFNKLQFQIFWDNQDNIPPKSDFDDKADEVQNKTKSEKRLPETSNNVTVLKKARNRELSKETRLRKKFFYESLQTEVRNLVRENIHLKSLMESLDPRVAEEITRVCCAERPPIVAAIANQATAVLTRADYGLISAISEAQRSFCITDPSLPDNPIVFASQWFLDLTGYSMDEVLGRNCRFLQGPKTDQNTVADLRKGIAQGADTSVLLFCYRKDGSTFWNQLFVAALRDKDNNIVNFVGVQSEVSVSASSKNMHITQSPPLSIELKNSCDKGVVELVKGK